MILTKILNMSKILGVCQGPRIVPEVHRTIKELSVVAISMSQK